MNSPRALLGLCVSTAFFLAPIAGGAGNGGTVHQLRVDARGQVSGVILSDGTEYVATPGQGEVMRQQFHPGDPVRVDASGPMAYSLRNERSGQVARAYAPEALARGGGPADGLRPAEVVQLPRLVVRGRVNMVTRNARGEPTGFVMQNGVQVHTNPGAIPTGVQTGEHLRVDGHGTVTPVGTGMVPVVIER